jgi:CheY-like chemotaxis protein
MPNVPLTVLVVDDTPSWRELVKSVLISELEITPLLASSGSQALGILNSRSIDVVVTDFNMPQMSGLEFMCKAKQRFPAPKFVIMTADTVSDIVAEECISRGAVAVVPKLEIEPELVSLLRELIAKC